MKTYHEMIQFAVDQADKRIFRYHELAAVLTIAEVYGIPREVVFDDIKFEIAFRDMAHKEARRLENLRVK